MATVYPAARNLCAATYSKLRSNNRATLDPAGGPEEARWPREWS